LEYYTKNYASQVTRFKKDIKAVAKLGGTKYKYCIRHFSNNTLDYLLGETTKLPPSFMDQIALKKNSSPQKLRRNSSPNAVNPNLFSGSPEFSISSRKSPARSSSNSGAALPDEVPTTRIVVHEGEYVARDVGPDDE